MISKVQFICKASYHIQCLKALYGSKTSKSNPCSQEKNPKHATHKKTEVRVATAVYVYGVSGHSNIRKDYG